MSKEQTEFIERSELTEVSKPRILIVDDEEIIRRLLTDILKNKYQVDSVEGSGSALENLIDYQYSVILLDVNMPGISGSDILKYCKKNLPYTEIIMISGDPEIDVAVEAVKNGAFNFIEKPFTVERINKEVEAAVQKYQENITSTSQFMLNSGGKFGSNTRFHNYRIVRTIGSGNMGIVLLVERDGKRYAMKILRSESKDMSYDKKVQRFLREAEILSKIDHPNIIRIYDFGLPKDRKMPYLVMEYVKGEDLIELIKRNSLTMEQKISIMKQIVFALEKVHENGIIHRDIKPSNVLVDEQFQAKLTDFGIARVSDSELTMENEVLGSPVYMCPECFDSSVELDVRSDIFSLGILCYELFTSKKPFNGNSLNEIMNTILKSKPVEPRKIVENVPAGVQNMLAKMLHKKPTNRYQTCREIIEDFQSVDIMSKNSPPITSRIFRRFFSRKSSIWA